MKSVRFEEVGTDCSSKHCESIKQKRERNINLIFPYYLSKHKLSYTHKYHSLNLKDSKKVFIYFAVNKITTEQQQGELISN